MVRFGITTNTITLMKTLTACSCPETNGTRRPISKSHDAVTDCEIMLENWLSVLREYSIVIE